MHTPRASITKHYHDVPIDVNDLLLESQSVARQGCTLHSSFYLLHIIETKSAKQNKYRFYASLVFAHACLIGRLFYSSEHPRNRFKNKQSSMGLLRLLL
jgi:hypothetical protein